MRIGTLSASLLAAGFIFCVGLFPSSSSALILGDITLHSNLGQPLRAVVPLRAEADEQLDMSCFSLVRPKQLDDFTYLTQASLALEEVKGRLQLRISSQHAISEPFIRLLVQADCGQGSSNRVFTLLLDPERSLSPSLPVLKATVPQVEIPAVVPRKPPKPRKLRAPVKSITATKPAIEVLEKPLPVPAAMPGDGEFRLKLSSDELDLSVLGKLTEEQRQHLREKQRLLDADDQVANMLSMKNRIMQLESEIGEMQAALAKTTSHMALNGHQAPAVANQPVPLSSGVDNTSGMLGGIPLRAMAGVGLILALLYSAWWWRRRQGDSDVGLENKLSQKLSFGTTRAKPVPTEKISPAPATEAEKTQEEEFFHDVTGMFNAEHESVTLTEADTVVDEADLYLAYGWSNRAIDLLKEYLEKHPGDVHLWKKLFETYSAEGMKQEFEQLALRCQTTMDDSGLWVLAQKLGRQLDAGNPLYSSGFEAESEIPANTELPALLLPALDQPLEFVLDGKSPEIPEIKEKQPEPVKESESLEFAPLFPDLFETPKKDPAIDPGPEKRS